MPHGTLEVLLLGAKDIENTDFFSNMDPYAIITCLTQEKRSSVASGKGTTPEWNETFLFTISDDVSELRIKIMDSDNLTQDDFVGEATIPLESLFHEGSIPPTSYNVTKDEQYCGEIRVGLTFTHQSTSTAKFAGLAIVVLQVQEIDRCILGDRCPLNPKRQWEDESVLRKECKTRERSGIQFRGGELWWMETICYGLICKQQHQRRRTTLANHPADVAVEEGARFIHVLSLSEEFLAKFLSKFRDDAAKLLVAYKGIFWMLRRVRIVNLYFVAIVGSDGRSSCSVFARNLPLGAMAALEPKLETNFGFDRGLP
ncbi:unnamed protein product [Camellia sinensis]